MGRVVSLSEIRSKYDCGQRHCLHSTGQRHPPQLLVFNDIKVTADSVAGGTVSSEEQRRLELYILV